MRDVPASYVSLPEGNYPVILGHALLAYSTAVWSSDSAKAKRQKNPVILGELSDSGRQG